MCSLFQLATGSIIDGVITSIETQIQNVLSQAQSLIESAQQQYNAIITQLTSVAQSRLDDLLQNFQENISNRFSDAVEAASRVPACLQAQQQNLSALSDDASK